MSRGIPRCEIAYKEVARRSRRADRYRMRINKLLLIACIILLAGLALKSLKQFIYLSFTLLSLKIVWMVLIVLVILSSLKKSSPSSRDSKRQ